MYRSSICLDPLQNNISLYHGKHDSAWRGVWFQGWESYLSNIDNDQVIPPGEAYHHACHDRGRFFASANIFFAIPTSLAISKSNMPATMKSAPLVNA